LADEPCELLFKAGGESCEPWESLLKKTNDLRVWWGFTQLSGVVYYRMRGYAEKMDAHGVESGFEAFAYDGSESQMKWQSRIKASFMQNELESILRVADMSIWQVMSTRWGISFLVCAKDVLKKPIITEVDDWLFDLPSYNVASNPFKPNSDMEWIAFKQLEISDAIICSTEYIKEHLKAFFPNKPIYVVRNSIDFDLWEKTDIEDINRYPKDDGIIRIGYTGCGNHNGDLELIRRPLRKIVEKYPQVEFMCYQEFEALKGLPRAKYTNKWITIDEYPDEIRRWNLDIGIAPLRDNDFNRSKSNLRWLEYSAMKIPTIASNVYPFSTSISNSNNGLVVKNSDLDWYEALENLVLNKERRLKIGEKAYQRVKRKYDMNKVTGEYASILREIKEWTDKQSKTKSGGSSATPTTIDGLQKQLDPV
jgi:glycosyltransferase involved in cell wall biosynthesis